ncbi:Ribokinase, partial [Dysosmobacter welbionis]
VPSTWIPIFDLSRSSSSFSSTTTVMGFPSMVWVSANSWPFRNTAEMSAATRSLKLGAPI